MPCLSLYVTVLPSALIPPFSLLGTSVARTDERVPSAAAVINGSQQKRPAMLSLVPCERCVLRIVGPCHIRIFSGPPVARPPLAAAGALVAAGAVVGAAAGLLVAAGAVVAGAPATDVGAPIDGAGDAHALRSEANALPVKAIAVRVSSVRRVNPPAKRIPLCRSFLVR